MGLVCTWQRGDALSERTSHLVCGERSGRAARGLDRLVLDYFCNTELVRCRMGQLFLYKHTRACAHVSTGAGGVPTEPRAVKTPARESGAGGAISAFQPLSSGFCGLLACSIEFECIHQYINI